MGKKNKGKKGKPLTGLAAALVKSGHLSEKKAKAISRDQRRGDKALGRKGVEEREEQQQQQAAAERLIEAEAARARANQRASSETDERACRAIRDNLHKAPGGGRQWFFAARDGRVLYMDVADQVAGLLARGEGGITESLSQAPGEHAVVVGGRALQTLVGIDKELVRFWNREEPR